MKETNGKKEPENIQECNTILCSECSHKNSLTILDDKDGVIFCGMRNAFCKINLHIYSQVEILPFEGD